MSITVGREERFGLAVELVSAAMKGLALYCLLLFVGFMRYQNGKAAFLPWYYMFLLPWTVLLAWLFWKLDGMVFILSHLVMVMIWAFFSYLSKGMLLYMLLAGAGMAGWSICMKFYRYDSDARRHVRRFKAQSYGRWGLVIALIFLLFYFDTSPVTPQYPISPDRCGSFMIAAFAIYLVLGVMMRYLYMQYDYFRARNGMSENMFRQLKRMNMIVAVVSTVVIAVVSWLAGKTVLKLLLWLVKYGLLAFFGLFQIDIKQSGSFVSRKLVIPEEGKGEAIQAVKSHASANTELRETLLAIVLIVLAIYLLWKLYQYVGANFLIGEDEAEFIKNDEEEQLIVEKAGRDRDEVRFGVSNREKIRRYFYRSMNRRMQKKDVKGMRSCTPQELVHVYGTPEDSEDLQKLVTYYEKARYSKEECTSQEVQEAKELGGI